MRKRNCKVEGCRTPKHARGLCRRHYAQWRAHGILDGDGLVIREPKRVPLKFQRETCSVRGCQNKVKTRGWCNKHYLRFRNGIMDENGKQLRKPAPRGRRPLDFRKEVAGYILVRAPKDHPNSRQDGSIYEHRFVMEQHLGRYLERGEVVHHINGVRDDNRIENLQLRRSRKDHGHGHERVEDVESALQLLERLVNKGMSNAKEFKTRLRRLARRL